MVTEPPSLLTLLRQAADGDVAATEQVLARLYPRVQELVHRELELDFRRHHQWLMPLFSTGDIVQDVFLGVVRGLGALDVRDERSVLAWLATQVKHRILDVVRRHEAVRRDRRLEIGLSPGGDQTDAPDLPGHDPTPSRCAELGEMLRGYEQAVASFSARERALLDLRINQQKAWKAIAGELGFPSDEAARLAFRYLKAKLLVKLRRLGVRPATLTGSSDPGGEAP